MPEAKNRSSHLERGERQAAETPSPSTESVRWLDPGMLAELAHRLRTPLNTICGFADLLGQGTYGTLNAKQKDRLQTIRSRCKEMLAIVNDTITIIRLDADRLVQETENVNIEKIVREVASDFLEERGAPCGRRDVVITPPSRTLEIHADKDRLGQAIRNLLCGFDASTLRHDILIDITEWSDGRIALSFVLELLPNDTSPCPSADESHEVPGAQRTRASIRESGPGEGVLRPLLPEPSSRRPVALHFAAAFSSLVGGQVLVDREDHGLRRAVMLLPRPARR